MKAAILVTLVCAGAFAAAGEVDMKVTGPGGLTGTAKVINRLQADGSKYVQLSMSLKSSSGQAVTVLQESTYESTGRPIRKIQVTTLAGGGSRQRLVAAFEAQHVQVTGEAGDKKIDDRHDIPAGKNIRAASEYWFIRDKPKPGDTTTYHRFDMAGAWVETKCVYHGLRTIKVSGREVKGHLVTFGDARAYVDDNGDPLRLEQNGVVMERLP